MTAEQPEQKMNMNTMSPVPELLAEANARLLGKTWGIVESAIRNPSVAEYHMGYWEGRASKSEARLAKLDSSLAEYRDGKRELPRYAELSALLRE